MKRKRIKSGGKVINAIQQELEKMEPLSKFNNICKLMFNSFACEIGGRSSIEWRDNIQFIGVGYFTIIAQFSK